MQHTSLPRCDLLVLASSDVHRIVHKIECRAAQMMISCFHCIFVSGLCALLMQWMVDGPGLRRALKLVAAALIAELVVSPHLRMAARIARMTQQAHATHTRVQVRIVWVNVLGYLRCSLHWTLRCVNKIELVFAHRNTCSRSSVQAVFRSSSTHPKVMTSLIYMHLSFCR